MAGDGYSQVIVPLGDAIKGGDALKVVDASKVEPCQGGSVIKVGVEQESRYMIDNLNE